MLDYSENVKRGMTFLDETFPDWVDHIDLDKLDMDHSGRCILGQLHGDYFEALNAGVSTIREAIDLGFDIDPGATAEARLFQGWPGLRAEWVKRITERREAAVVKEDESAQAP